MSAHANPDIVDDNLVFMYDTNDGKSYKGEPTTNVNTFTLSDSGTDGSGQSSVGTRTVITNNHVRIVDVASNTRQSHLITGLTASTTYTVSIMYKKLAGTPTFRFQIQDYSSSSYLRTIKFTNTSEIGIEDKEGWQLASWTFTLGSDANAVRIWYQDGADYTTYTHSFELQNPQLEAKSHATPYVDGTRSATQGLLDRTGTSTINISNASFDSNAQMTFDGTDDYISIPTYTFGNGSWTLNAWVNPDVVSGYNIMSNSSGGPVTNAFGFNGGKIHYRNYDGNWRYHDGNTTLPINNSYMLTWVNYEGASASAGTMKMYVNGVADSDVFNSYTTNGGPCNAIGRNWTSAFYNGKITQVSINTKSFSDAEVLQNFNATKSRFSL